MKAHRRDSQRRVAVRPAGGGLTTSGDGVRRTAPASRSSAAWRVAASARRRPTFKRGATLVEFFNFPATAGDGRPGASGTGLSAGAVGAGCSISTNCTVSVSITCAFRSILGPLMQGTMNAATRHHRRPGHRRRRDQAPRPRRAGDALSAFAGARTAANLSRWSRWAEIQALRGDGRARCLGARCGRFRRVALEPMNEPQSQCRIIFGTDWTAYQQIMVERMRRICAAAAAVPDRRLLVEHRRHRAPRYRSAARPAQFRQRALLLSVPVHAPGRDLDHALSRRHHRRALSGFGGQP